jgi:hypothetical protein
MTTSYRQILALKISQNRGASWRTVAICDDCHDSLKPPTVWKDAGGVQGGHILSCDWCGAFNVLNKPSEQPSFLQGEMQFDWNSFSEALHHQLAAEGSAAEEATDVVLTEENLPVEAVMLDVEYSPVIPLWRGSLKDAVEVEKLNDNAYRYWFRGEMKTVSAERLKEMRARYIVAHNTEAKKHLRDYHPPGSIWHKVGSHGLAETGKIG